MLSTNYLNNSPPPCPNGVTTYACRQPHLKLEEGPRLLRDSLTQLSSFHRCCRILTMPMTFTILPVTSSITMGPTTYLRLTLVAWTFIPQVWPSLRMLHTNLLVAVGLHRQVSWSNNEHFLFFYGRYQQVGPGLYIYVSFVDTAHITRV